MNYKHFCHIHTLWKWVENKLLIHLFELNCDLTLQAAIHKDKWQLKVSVCSRLLCLRFMTAQPRRELHTPRKGKHVAGYRVTPASAQSESSAIWSDCSIVFFPMIDVSGCGVTDDVECEKVSPNFPPRKSTQICCLMLFINMCALLSLWERLRKIAWAFLSGRMCADGGGCLLASGYIRCYRRNLYCWVWDSYGNG